jgi:hypothetical protein
VLSALDQERSKTMGRVKIEDVISHLDSDIRKALEAAVKEILPNAQFDPYELFRAFRRAVGRKCSTWENVPDYYIEL